MRLDDGAAEVKLKRFPAEARVGVRAGRPTLRSPFMWTTCGSPACAVPGLFVDWVVRNFDPTPRLRACPFPVSLGTVRIRPGRLEIGEPLGAAVGQILQPPATRSRE